MVPSVTLVVWHVVIRGVTCGVCDVCVEVWDSTSMMGEMRRLSIVAYFASSIYMYGVMVVMIPMVTL